jgi:hypothetical protein
MHSRHIIRVVETSLPSNVVRLDDYRRTPGRSRATRDLVVASLLRWPDPPRR